MTTLNTATAARRPMAAPASERRTYAPMMPTSLAWCAAFYVGVPLFLTIMFSDGRPWATLARSFGAFVVSTLAIGGLVHASYVWLMPRAVARLDSRAGRLAAHMTTILSSVAIGNTLAAPILPHICETEGKSPNDMLIGVTVTAAVVLATTSYTELQRRTRETEEREQAAQRALLRAQLEALQARTNPHFLFNSLNTVASLIPDQPRVAEETLERLCDLFRYALEGSRRTRVSLDAELGTAEDYLEVEALRFGDRLSWRIDRHGSLEGVELPPLTIQPLVENAILHGVASCKNGGAVDVTVTGEPSRVTVVVVNDVAQADPHRGGLGTALADLQQRLAVAYDGQATLERIERDGRFSVTLTMPRRMHVPTYAAAYPAQS